MGKKLKPATDQSQIPLDDVTGQFTVHDYQGQQVRSFSLTGGTMEEALKFLDRVLAFPWRGDYLTPADIALVAMVTNTRVRQWVDEGKLTAVRNNRGHMKILRTEALAFIETLPPQRKKRK